MAIKGKRKGKARSGRVVTAGPRPAYVPPKVPLFQRTGAKFLVALIFEAAIFSLVVGFGEQSEDTRQRDHIGEFTAHIEAALGGAGDAIQPTPGGALVLPQLGTRLTELIGESPPKPDDVVAETDRWSAALTEAADAVLGVELVPGDLEPTQVLFLTEARTQMNRGLRLSAGLAEQTGIAAGLEGAAREELVTTIQSQLEQAGATFSSGYGKLQEVRRLMGLPTSGSLPGGGFPAQFAPPAGFEPPVVEEPVDEAPSGGGGGKGNGKGGKGGGGGGG